MFDAVAQVPDTAFPAALIGAAVTIIVTLLRLRTTERASLANLQQAHMDRLTSERVHAEDRAEILSDALDEERQRVTDAVDRASKAEASARLCQEKVAELTAQISLLRTEIVELRAYVAQLHQP